MLENDRYNFINKNAHVQNFGAYYWNYSENSNLKLDLNTFKSKLSEFCYIFNL